ncbi:MAG TPA: Rossmann-like and DUF2520 domain-containing protein [Candidatus Polarisedimenticolaceae bacterium]|nr:Rossmann-like and DUF2520 domain-containing protein [Candidatus Polarisedimenticolaceae bacterium]
MSRAGRATLAIVGTGRLAAALAAAAAASRWPVAVVAGRRRQPIAEVKRTARAACGTRSPARAARLGEVVLLAVTDDAIESVAQRLAEANVEFAERVVLHHAGALGPEALAPLARRGAAVGVLHPLQALGSGRGPVGLLRGARVRIEGHARAVAVARRLARAFGMVPLRLTRQLGARDRVAYHAAASLASNDLVALFATAIEVFESIGTTRGEAIAALTPLVRATLEQLAAAGPRGALTGPVARGDVETLERHLDELPRRVPEAAEIHRVLSLRLLAIAERLHPGQASEARRRIRRLLDPVRAGRRRGPAV